MTTILNLKLILISLLVLMFMLTNLLRSKKFQLKVVLHKLNIFLLVLLLDAKLTQLILTPKEQHQLDMMFLILDLIQIF
jgi:hypothetical protein